MPALQTNIQAEINKLQQTSAYVTLFKVDGSAFGGPVFRFTNNPNSAGAGVQFQGFTYQPIPIHAEGFDVTASGTMAKPTLSLGNVGKVVMASMRDYGDMVGWKVTRLRTYEKFLDAGATPNASACIGPEVWLVEKLIQRSAQGISWQLTTSLDRMAFRAGRQILKDPSVKNVFAPGISRTRVR